MPTDEELRRQIAATYIRGRGFEIGAGLAPSYGNSIEELCFIDKRDAVEFASMFGRPPEYQILSFEKAKSYFLGGADFIIAHHVLEHCSNPISELRELWLPLLRDGGVLFVSMPSPRMDSEQGRVVTPINHLLDDWAFNRGDNDFESIDHIFSFIMGWTYAHPDHFWYSKGTIQQYAGTVLSEINREEHDLHWHTYSLKTATQLTEVAFYTAGAGIEWLHRKEVKDCLYLVAKRLPQAVGAAEPDVLKSYRQRLLEAYRRTTTVHKPA